MQIAPSTYYDHINRQPSRRQVRDEALKAEIARVHAANYGVYGARKMWLALHREGIAVARCTVERLMAELGLSGAVRGKTRRTTIADPTAARPADLVQRQFAPPAPNRLWVADLTYVSTWSGFAYVAFVVDAYARRILGWRVAATMATSMVLDAIEQAIWTRQQEGILDLKDVVHHTDRGSQGGFNWSSQHLDQEVCGWDGQEGGRQQRQGGRRCGRQAGLRWRGVSIGNGSGRRSLTGCPARTPGWRPACRLRSGTRWFRESGGMPSVTQKPLSGRYLSFAEREEIAILRAQDCGVREIARRHRPCGVDDFTGVAP